MQSNLQVTVYLTYFMFCVYTDRAQLCAICYADFALQENATRLRCGHIFHTECITTWVEQSEDYVSLLLFYACKIGSLYN